MVRSPSLFLFAYLCLVGNYQQLQALGLWQAEEPKDPSDYGVDISFPIHHYIDQAKSPIGHKRYGDMMKGCYEKFSKRECDGTERARMDMNMAQPKSQHNYTEIGFKKLKAPAAAWEPLLSFYEANQHKLKPENWPRGNTYVNSWDSPTYMVSLEDPALRGGLNVKQQIWAGVKPILEEWTGHKLTPTSLYGIRVYKDGAMLSTHVDRLPLVSSCIIQVAQDIDEPWPIEVYDHNGKAYNVTMQPGEMVLYESHTVLHGRPFPLKGRTYANVFVHFQPVDHDSMNTQDAEERAHPKPKKTVGGITDHINNLLFTKDSKKKTPAVPVGKGNIGGHEQMNHDEEHVQRHMEDIDREHALASAAAADTLKLKKLKEDAMLDDRASAIKATLDAARLKADQMREQVAAQRAESGLVDPDEPATRGERVLARFNRRFASVDSSEEEHRGSQTAIAAAEMDAKRHAAGNDANSDAHEASDKMAVSEALRDAAANGDYEALTDILDEQHIPLIHNKDENDWQILHEAIRGGDLDSVKLLIDLGADIGSKVAGGGAALWIAQSYLEEGHAVTQYLKDIGAPEEAEEL